MLEILKNYIKNIQNLSFDDNEYSYNNSFHSFIKESSLKFSKKLSLSEQKRHKSILIPDYTIYKDTLISGLIELKAVSKDIKDIEKFFKDAKAKEQIFKYFELCKNILLSDYLNFHLLSLDEKNNLRVLLSINLCELTNLKNIAKSLKQKEDSSSFFKEYDLKQKAREFEDLFEIFFNKEPSSINSASDFANALAIRTKMLKEKLSQNTNNNEIIQIYKTFNDILYKGILDDDKFADSFAQVITYGLFLARLNIDEKIELDNAKRFIPKNFPLIKSMLSFLDSEKLDELDMDIKYIIKDIINIINHIDIGSLVRELNKISQKDLYGEYIHKDPYIHFYESFLSKYDKDLRKLRGVYYTPTPVVKFIVDSIDLSLKKHLNQEKGLVTALDSEKITLLDFATGTGTFLLEAFRKVYDGVKDEIPSSKSPKFDDFKRYFKKIVKNFKGFELLIAPYVIAHLKISQVFKDEFNFALENTDKKEYEILNIKLTNTLHFDDDKNKHQNIFSQMSILKELSNEFLEAQNVKEKEILIITGNPPYSGASSNKGLYEKEVQVAYKNPMETPNNPTAILKNNKIEKEKNPKWLLDDYVKFIRFAESKIENQDSGIFAFISNNSFLDNPTFRGMRYHLMQSFDTLYILDLHGNTRKKELSPDGSKDENVFDIMQGVSINIFIKNRNSPLGNHTESKEPHCQIYHYDLYGKRKDKYNFLYENSLDSIPWNRLNPKPPFFLFIPQNESLREEYDRGISVKDMFRISSVGVVTGKDSVFIANDMQTLKEQIINYCNEFDEELAQDIAYRPFDIRKIYYDTAKIARARKEVMEHFLQDSVSLQGEAKESKNIGLVYKRGFPNTQSGQGFATKNIIDFRTWSCAGMQGGDYISPLYLQNTESTQKNLKKSEKESLFDDEDIFQGKERIENFTPEFRSFVDSKYTWDSKDIEANPQLFLDSNTLTPEAILGYIYAVLFHKDYREKYIDFLKSDFPKIPFVESKEKFIALSKLGLELMSVHLMADNERERERTEINENESQYWANLAKTVSKSGIQAHIHSSHDNGDVLYLQQNQRRELHIPSLSLQHQESKEDSMQRVNIALVCDRGCKLNKIDNIFITQNIIDLHLVGSGSYAFPLYLYNKES